jgi:hypothetical protein
MCYHVCEVIEATEVFKTTLCGLFGGVLFREMKFVLSNFLFEKKNSEQNDEISSEILPSLRTEALEDRDVIFNQSQVS